MRVAREALDLSAEVGAKTAYLVPDAESDEDGLKRFAARVAELADHAAGLDIELCLEHFPGRAIPTIAQMVDVIDGIGHPNVSLLLDIGHAQITGEDPATALQSHGDRVGYVHFDDNDGEQDLHYGLFEGIMAEDTVARVLDELEARQWSKPLSLELSWELDDPAASLQRSMEAVQGLLARV